MKVIRLTPVRLVVKETMIGLRILSFLTTLVGFYIFISFEPPADLFGGLCIAIASFINVMSPTEICTFDKTLDRLTFLRLRGLGATVSHHRISRIQDVAIAQNNFVGTSFYWVELSFEDGQKIPLTRSISTDMTKQTQLAHEITTFIRYRRRLRNLKFERVN